MKLDVIRHSGCVVRLHDFDRAELLQLRCCIAALAWAARSSVALHEEPFVRPLAGCRLTLWLAASDDGLRPAPERNLFGWTFQPGTWDPFACTLSAQSWARVAQGIDPLLRLRFICSEHIWLHRQWHNSTPVSWLLSPDGDW